MNKFYYSKVKEKIFSKKEFILILIISLLSLLIRFFWIEKESIWLDEAASLSLAAKVDLDFAKFFNDTYWTDPHPIFYYLILKIWIIIFGNGALAIRSLSALFGILTVLLTYYFFSKTINKKVGLFSSIFLLVNPINIWYSQEARMYTLTSLLILLSVYYCFQLNKNGLHKKDTIILYILFSTLLIYTDYIGLLVLGVEFLFSFIYSFRLKEIKKKVYILVSYLIIFLLYIPWLHNLFYVFKQGGTTWMSKPTLANGIGAFTDIYGLTPFSGGLTDICSVNSFFCIIILISLFFILFILAFSLFQTFQESKKELDMRFLIVLICFIPVLMFLFSIFLIPIFNVRQISAFVPELILLLTFGLVSAPNKVTKFFKNFLKINLRSKNLNIIHQGFSIFIILIITINSFNLISSYITIEKEDWKNTVKYIENNGSDDDIIFLDSTYVGLPFLYYYNGNIPTVGISNINEINEYIYIYDNIWIIFSHAKLKEEILNYIEFNATLILYKHFFGIDLYYYNITR